MLDIVRIVKSDQCASIKELDGFTDIEKEQLVIAQKALNNVLKPALILNNWLIAYQFFCDNIPRLLDSTTGIRTDFIEYQFKIVLNAGLEFMDTIKRYLIHKFPETITKQNGETNKQENHSKGEWFFKELSSKIYDDNFSYRLCYNLRNCFQHVGLEGVSLEKNEYGSQIVLDKHNYLNGHAGIQNRFKQELISLPDNKIDLISSINMYNNNLIELYKNIELIYHNKHIYDELYSSLLIKKLMPFEENELTKYAILHRDDNNEKNDMLTCKIDFININKAVEFVEMHCKFFCMIGQCSIDEKINQCPFQISEFTYFKGSYRFVSNEMPYVKIEESISNNRYDVIYVLECLFPEERSAVINAVKDFLHQ